MHEHEHCHDENCSCHEHEHHHHGHHHDEHCHDENCSCHEHEHHHHGHHHDEHCHDENCSCHEHEHHHHHGEGCSCEECAPSAFRFTRVEGATAAAAHFRMAGEQDAIVSEVSSRVQALCGDIDELGGFVGHVKGAVQNEGDLTTFSCTGGAVTLATKAAEGCQIDLVAIVVGLGDEDLEKAIRGRFPEIGD